MIRPIVKYRLLTKDRSWRWFQTVGRLSRQEDGTPVTFVGMFVYVAEREEMQSRLDAQQRQLEQAVEDAQAANRAKTTFLANMSHDLRTPMNAIIGFTTLANSHAENSDEVKSYLDKIATSSEYPLSLINDILDMGRIESGYVVFQEQARSLTDIMYDIRTIAQSDTNAKRLEFYVDMMHGEISVKSEEGKGTEFTISLTSSDPLPICRQIPERESEFCPCPRGHIPQWGEWCCTGCA